MCARSAMEARASEADDGLGHDHRRLIRHLLRFANRFAHCVAIVAVDFLHVPADRLEALLHVFGERVTRRTVQRHVVVIVEIDEVAQTEMTGE